MSRKKAQLFKETSVWRRIDDITLVQYRCLEVIPDAGYFVKSSHFYHEPIDREQIYQAQFYFLDGMLGDALLEIPKETFDTLEEAIAQHERDFDKAFE